MLSVKSSHTLVHLGLLLGLSACSDATQFTELAQPYTLDAEQAESGAPQTNGETSLDPLPQSSPTEESVNDGLVYEGKVVEEASDMEQPGPEAVAESKESQAPGDKIDESAKAGTGQTSNKTGGTGTGGTGGTGGTQAGQTQIAGTGTPTVGPMLFSACDTNAQQSIVAQVYKLPEDTQKLPSFSGLPAIGNDVCLSQLNIGQRSFTEGFPGVADLIEWFALDINFKVDVPTTGTYAFTVKSDDGSIMYIDGQKVVDNDGLHPTQEVTANKTLTKGVHNFRIKYYQGPRYYIALELFWKIPGATARTYIPESLLSRP